MDKLSKEDVMHIADLAMLELNDEELSRYSVELKTLFNEIDKVQNLDVDGDIMFSASEEKMQMFNDEYKENENSNKLIDNAPVKEENFIEVAGVFDE